MASMREIKRRISSVKSTQQITRAMNLVAASKLQRAKIQLDNLRPFVTETMRVLSSVTSFLTDSSSIYITGRPVKNSLIIAIAADRGLCGGYNVNLCKEAFKLVSEKDNEQLITVGTKARDYFRRRGKNIIRTYQGFSESPFYEDASEIGLLATDYYESGDSDEVYVVYTEFSSALNHTPTVKKLLPLPVEAGSSASSGFMDFEPNQSAILSHLVPKYVSTAIFGAMVESAACEQGARMTSMDSATKNSAELINKFTLQYNRARQDAITQELSEIVSGANAI